MSLSINDEHAIVSLNDDNDDDDDDASDDRTDELLGFADGSSQPLLSSNTRVLPRTSTPNTGPSYTSCSAAVFLTVNAALGAGLLNVPFAFNESGGIIYALIVQCILVVFIIGSLFILTFCSQICNAVSYHDVIVAFCGIKLQYLSTASIILYSYGACLTFIIIIGDQFDRTFLSLYGSDFSDYWYLNRKFTMLAASTLFILPLSFSKTIDFLKYASSFGVIATLYIIFLAIYEYFRIDTQNVIIKTKPDSWTEVFYAAPVICFSYQCHISWVPTYAGMKERSGSMKIGLTIVVSIVICFLCYSLTAIFGLMTFGSTQIESDLTKNYDASDGVVLTGIIILVAKTVTIYPLLLFCGRVAIEDFIIKMFKLEPSSPYEFYRRSIIVILWFFSTIIIAILIPNISVAIEFLGSLASAFVFIFPGLCLMSAILRKDSHLFLNKDKIYIFIASLYIILGVFIFGLTLTHVIKHDIDLYKNSFTNI